MAESSGFSVLSAAASEFDSRLPARQLQGKIFEWACLIATLLGLFLLAVLLADIFIDGSGRFSLRLFTNFPSSLRPQEAGFRSAILGSLILLAYTLLLVVPVGIATAIYLEEYAPKNRLTDFIDLNIYNLAAVPSIVYGILGLGMFVRALYGGRAVLMAGIFTIALLILPPIIVVSREAIRAVPQSIRQASYGVGATKWQTIRYHVLPYALPGILTGVIVSISRGVGETAPIVVLGAGTVLFDPKAMPFDVGALLGATKNTFLGAVWAPDNFFSVLPYQVYEWVSDPKDEFKQLASAGIILLLIVVIGLNALAIVLRNRAQQ